MEHCLRNIVALMILLISTAQAADSGNRPHLDQAALQSVVAQPAVEGTESTSFESLSGKPLLVTFFASWCPPCREEFAHLNELHEKYADTDLRIIAINVYEEWDDNDEARMRKFIDAAQPRFPAIKGSESIRALFGGIDRIPTVLGFGAYGKHVYKFVHKRGARKTNATFEELDAAAVQLLNAG